MMMMMFEPSWNPQVDEQALARIYRPGQRRACHVYQLFVANSWEEVIFLSQTKKKQLFEPMSLKQVASFFFQAHRCQRVKHGSILAAIQTGKTKCRWGPEPIQERWPTAFSPCTWMWVSRITLWHRSQNMFHSHMRCYFDL